MSEVVIEALKATVYVSRKVSDGKYGSHEFAVHVPVELDQSKTVLDQSDAVLATFEQAKAIVATQSQPLLAALVEADFAKPALRSVPAGRTAPAATNNSPTVPYFCDKDGKITEHFDNRADIESGRAKPRSPKLKCKVCRNGVWDIVEDSKEGQEAF